MESTENNPQPDTTHRAYEPDEVRLKWFAAGVAAFALTGIVVLALVWRIMNMTARSARAIDQPQSAIRSIMPPSFAPPLQPAPWHDHSPREDLAALRQREDQIFAHLGWTRDDKTRHFNPPNALVQNLRRKRQPATRPGGGS